MKVLVAVVDYPNNDGNRSMMFVHVRNQYYRENGVDVSVLNFSAKQNYEIDGIRVITFSYYKKNIDFNYDVLISHAANIRNHYRFLKKYEKNFEKLLFFFHGHEVLKLNEVYPAPFKFFKQASKPRKVFQNLYDSFKLKLWNKYYTKITYKSQFIFVSNWLYQKFLMYTKIDPIKIDYHVSIIHNSVAKVFEENKYQYDTEKEYDFITIRSHMDESKYCVDIVNELAKNNSDLKFLLVGKGEIFNHIKKEKNITWINMTLKHEEMLNLMNSSKCGLLPTRQDTQGVMTCEMATFGLPVITSNIDVCHEICGELQNVNFIDNNNMKVDLNSMLKKLIEKGPYQVNKKYYSINTTMYELKILGIKRL